MFYRINWHAASKTILLESGSGSPPAAISGGGHTSIGTFEHGPDPDDESLAGMQDFTENHVLYHHVQEALYKIGIQDMQRLTILRDAPRTISIGSGTINVEVGDDTAALTATYVPANTPEKELIFTSSDVTKATVNEDGVVHGVAIGTAVITAKLKIKDTITATRNINVIAATP